MTTPGMPISFLRKLCKEAGGRGIEEFTSSTVRPPLLVIILSLISLT
jgi:hypothetical protein